MVFANRSRDRDKLLHRDGTGVWIFLTKHLKKDHFCRFAVTGSKLALTSRELDSLLSGSNPKPKKVNAQSEAFEKFGEERSFEVDITPPRLFKRVSMRPNYRRKSEPSFPPLVAPAPARMAASGYASAGLIAWEMTAEYSDHAPLFR